MSNQSTISKRDFLYWLAIVWLIGCLFFLDKCRRDESRFNDLQQQVLTDSLVITTNALGQQTAQTGLILADFRSFAKLHFLKEDSLGRQLQKLVTKRTISATVATQVVSIKTTLATDSVILSEGFRSEETCIGIQDTSPRKASVQYDNIPVYVMNDTTAYRTMAIEAGRDSFKVNLRLYEKLTFEQEWTRWSPFKKQSCITKYTNSNPEVEITGLRTYTVKCDCGKKGWLAFAGGNITGFAIGMGAGYITGKLK